MIQAHISRKDEQSLITATGSVDEILTDVVVLINSLHTQFSTNDPVTGQLFRQGLTGMVNDPNGPLWTPMGGQTGIVFKKP